MPFKIIDVVLRTHKNHIVNQTMFYLCISVFESSPALKCSSVLTLLNSVSAEAEGDNMSSL